MSPKERVDRLLEAVQREINTTPTTVVAEADDWDWFANAAIRGDHPKIRFDGGRLMYGDVRIKRHR